MSGSAGAAGGRSAIATGFVATQPRRSENAKTPCANWRWFVTVFIARPAWRFAAM